jgi:hypothetical protein
MLRFYSRRDFLFTFLLLLLPSTGLGAFLLAIVRAPGSVVGQRSSELLTMLLGGGLLIALCYFLIWSWVATYYEIDKTELRYRSGIFRGSIDLRRINSVKKAAYPNVGNRPALGLTGLIINYEAGYELFVSPADEAGFLQALVDRGVLL